ncbi:MAG: carboxypeptidase-like regulatory domain-containing protein, partial [Candidatus Moraniibacteriota bacterium]
FNFLLFVFYLFMAGVKYFYLEGSNWGEVLNQKGKPLQFATIKLYNQETGQRVSRVVTDQLGRYFLIANPGQYLLKVRSVGSHSSDITKEITLKKRGAIEEKLRV